MADWTDALAELTAALDKAEAAWAAQTKAAVEQTKTAASRITALTDAIESETAVVTDAEWHAQRPSDPFGSLHQGTGLLDRTEG